MPARVIINLVSTRDVDPKCLAHRRSGHLVIFSAPASCLRLPILPKEPAGRPEEVFTAPMPVRALCSLEFSSLTSYT